MAKVNTNLMGLSNLDWSPVGQQHGIDYEETFRPVVKISQAGTNNCFDIWMAFVST